MTEPAPPPPPPASKPPWATHVLIPTQWTPEQALAVFELLTDLRNAVASLYAHQIQDLLRETQTCSVADLAAGGLKSRLARCPPHQPRQLTQHVAPAKYSHATNPRRLRADSRRQRQLIACERRPSGSRRSQFLDDR